jgi:hypothetical protein
LCEEKLLIKTDGFCEQKGFPEDVGRLRTAGGGIHPSGLPEQRVRKVIS